MKTTKFFIASFILLASSSIFAQSYVIDTQKSSIKWFATKVTGKHDGSINLKSGEMTLKSERIESGTFVIDMNSIKVLDVKDPGTNQKLLGHLKSDDFFGVATYPDAKLVITTSTAFKDNKAIVKGNLTIKGKTNLITFDAVRAGQNYQAKIVVDRSKYDVKYGSTSFFEGLGDKAISNEFTLEIDLVVNTK